MADMRSAALDYAAHGLAVFPLVPRRKEPACEHGVKDATLDAVEIEEAWGGQPDMNVAIACGAASGGLMVIDIDVDDSTGKDGMEHLLSWERGHGELPETASVVTGRGGMHLYYRVDGPVKNSVNEELGIDIRGDGGYVMAPPSIHPNGRRVEWENDPEEFGVADADENVLAFVESVRPSGFGERRKKVDITKRHHQGGRNKALFQALCSARSAGFDDAAMEAFAMTYNSLQLDPPLPGDEVRRTLDSVLMYEPGNKEVEDSKPPSTRGRRGPSFKHNECARALMDERGACFIDGMPAIRRNGRYEVGWRAVDDAIISMHDDVPKSKQNEVHHYLMVRAPRVEQSRPTLIGFSNGVLDVEAMELRDYRDDDVIPNVIPHAWNADAKSEAVDGVLEKMACGDVGMQLNLTEVVGLCMYRNNRHYPICPVLLGEGSNGKSTYISMLRNVVGRENASALQPREIGARFQAAMLLGKLANLGDDISNDYLDGDSCAVIKKVATGDDLYTDVKGGEGFSFTPYCTMVFSANKFPRLGDASDGMMRRLFPMQFNARFTADDPDYDPMIGEKLSTDEAAEYLCKIGVEGLRRVISQGGMTPNEASKTIRHDIQVSNDTVLAWIDDAGTEPEDVIGKTKDECYADYRSWCESNGVQPVSARKMSGTFLAHWHISLARIVHKEFSDGRKTVRVYERL